MEEIKTVSHFIFNGSIVLPLSMRYASLAFCTLSLLDNPRAIIIVLLWLLIRFNEL